MLLVMRVMAVRSVHQRSSELKDAAEVDEKECTERQRTGGCDGACRCPAKVRLVPASCQGEDFGDGKLSQQVAEEDEEKERPQERNESVGVLLQRRTENFNPQKLENRFEKVAGTA